jgi:hypothetical protein
MNGKPTLNEVTLSHLRKYALRQGRKDVTCVRRDRCNNLSLSLTHTHTHTQTEVYSKALFHVKQFITVLNNVRFT